MRQQVMTLGAMDHDPVAQWIERQIADLQVAGSTPVGIALAPQAIWGAFFMYSSHEICSRRTKDFQVACCASMDLRKQD